MRSLHHNAELIRWIRTLIAGLGHGLTAALVALTFVAGVPRAAAREWNVDATMDGVTLAEDQDGG